MDTNAIITLGLGVGTILSSGITSAVVTYWLNRRKDQSEFMRTKAEALYLAADEYGRMLGNYTLPHFQVIKGEITWNDMLDIHMKLADQKVHGGYETMRMLSDIYFPSVRPALLTVIEARKSFNEMAFEMKKTYKQGQGLDPHTWMPRMMTETDDIDASIKSFQTAIVEAARGYAGVRQQ